MTPTTVLKSEVHAGTKLKRVRMKLGNILKNVSDEKLVAYSGKSVIALEELKRRTTLEEMQDEAGAGLGDIAAVGYQDLDVFGLLDKNDSNSLDAEELESLAGLLDIGTGSQLYEAIKAESTDGEVTPLEFSNWWYKHVGDM